jgi:hypothetical protein
LLRKIFLADIALLSLLRLALFDKFLPDAVCAPVHVYCGLAAAGDLLELDCIFGGMDTHTLERMAGFEH